MKSHNLCSYGTSMYQNRPRYVHVPEQSIDICMNVVHARTSGWITGTYQTYVDAPIFFSCCFEVVKPASNRSCLVLLNCLSCIGLQASISVNVFYLMAAIFPALKQWLKYLVPLLHFYFWCNFFSCKCNFFIKILKHECFYVKIGHTQNYFKL